MDSSSGRKPAVWKHIGLYGHAVGTFTANEAGVSWKSAAGTNDDNFETKKSLPADSIAGALWTVFGKSGHLRILTKSTDKAAAAATKQHPPAYRYDGFPSSDYDTLASAFQSFYNIPLKRHSMSSAGNSWGNTNISNKHLVFRQCILEDADEEGQEEFEPRDGDEMLSMDLGEVSQCVLPGNNRNEIEMQFLESDTVEAGTDQLVAIRFYVPPDMDVDPSDKEAATPAEVLQSRIMQVASVKKTSGSIIAEFDESKGTFLTPRGRYSIELYDSFLRMRGAKYDYKIRYDDISRLFLLPKQDDMHKAFVIALDKPIRQGQQRYNMLVMQCTNEPSELDVNLDEATLEKEYGGQIQSHMTGSFSNLVAKTFKVITKKKVFIPGKFANANQQACVKCALRANEGHLYPLEKQFIFIHKPAVLIRFDEIESVEFQRYAGGQGSTRNFDLSVSLQSTPGDNLSVKEYTFSGIDKTNYSALYSFLSGKKIKIKNIEEAGGEEEPTRGAPLYNEMDEDDEEESEDEDYDQQKAPESESEDMSDGDDDDDMGSVVSDDSDLAEYKKKAKKAEKTGSAKKKKSKKSKDVDDEETSPKKRKAVGGKKKKKKDPNAPKNAKSAYLYFSSAKRDEIKAANPDATFGQIGKLLGEEWKKISDDDKVEFEEKAEEDKKRYKKEMEDYTPPSDDDDSDDGGGKKKAKRAKKDPNAPKGPMNAYMLFANSVRAQVREENPDLSMTEVSKEISQKYKSLDEDEMAKWKGKAGEAKEDYKKKLAAYEKSKPADEKKSEKKPSKKKPVKEKKEKKPEPKPASSDSEDSGSYASSSDSDSDESD
ncbi:FACT complex subunit SSRP1 [Skeletonema marinoi]|uniref:FACT complex subunit SSRP1 n=1 Tax=Skeletonema marinoi TaxID=267567 RepID=A0AAD8Y2G7_9STRA|nr:FACT complex subunit SSRP1 [Skeletonema marinoi]|mmetsp:Transcript_10603/g.15638  ORF Transcript_10603/g.15638 Transcript_10603/m.15638 type:complete len:824 (+) Transcript_10603:211-2682(+)